MEYNNRNRDRRGGHEVTEFLYENGYALAYTPAKRKYAKRLSRREMRRESAKIIRESVSTWERDAYEDYILRRDEDCDYNDSFNDWLNEQDPWYGYEDEPDLHDPMDDYCTEFDNYMDHLDYSYADNYYSYQREETPHDRIIKEEDCGKSLGDLLQEIQDRKEAMHGLY